MGKKTGSPLVPWKIRVKILKITSFSPFFATRWRQGGLKTSKMDSQRPITPILTPHTCLNSLWGRNGEKLDFESSTGPKFFENDPKKGSEPKFSPFRPKREFRHVWGVKIGVFWVGKSIFEGFRVLRGLLGVLILINPSTNHQKKFKQPFFDHLWSKWAVFLHEPSNRHWDWDWDWYWDWDWESTKV